MLWGPDGKPLESDYWSKLDSGLWVPESLNPDQWVSFKMPKSPTELTFENVVTKKMVFFETSPIFWKVFDLPQEEPEPNDLLNDMLRLRRLAEEAKREDSEA